MKLSTAITHFDTQLRADGKSDRTRQAYLRDLGKLRCWLKKDAEVTSITPDTLARFLADGNGSSTSALTVNRTKTAFRVFFRFLNDAGCLCENPARLIRSTPTDRRVPSYLSADEARALLRAFGKRDGDIARRDHAMFSLLLGTGIRLGSLVALKVCDVNLTEKAVTIRAKGGREETVFLAARLRRVLKGYIKAQIPALAEGCRRHEASLYPLATSYICYAPLLQNRRPAAGTACARSQAHRHD
jgi:integrase/recombinase XerC